MRSLAAIVLLMSWWGPAYADEPHTEADKLFEEAQALKQAGKTAEACAKYEEALAKNRNAVGTLLNVAKCDEDAGKIATAVKLYTQARDLARENNLDEHRAAAEARIGPLGERVPRLAIAFSERLPGMKLVIDDEVYPTDAESTSQLRLDPGTRHIVVTAPGRLPYSTNVDLVEGKPAAVAIPQLPRGVTVKSARRSVGKVLTFSGAGLALTGVVLGYVANRDYEREVGPLGSMKPCIQEGAAKPLCNADGYQRTSSARQLGTVGTVVGVAGVAALGLGVVLWFTAPSEMAEHQVSVVPSLTHDSAGIAAVGRF